MMVATKQFEANPFGKRLKSMLKVDFRRMFTMPLFYIVVGICLVMPVLILVMTTMMAGPGTDPVTGEVTVIEAFTNVWQIIGTVSGESSEAAMGDMTSMCNINLLYFFVAVLVCVFVSEDFKSGYAKNLFTVRAKKSDYVISKTLVCFVGGACMILAFFVGAMLGGAISGLSFAVGTASVGGIACCLIAKMVLISVFVPSYLVMSVVGKQRLWLSLICSFGVGMFLFMMIPMVSPLNATPLHVLLCLAGGAMFGVGLGAISNLVLKKTSLV